MSRAVIKPALILVIFCQLLAADGSLAGKYDEAPVPVRGAVLMKLLAFNKSLSGDVSLYVLGDSGFADEMKKHVGKAISGSLVLTAVESGSEVPPTSPSILYVGDLAMLDQATAYSRENKILSVGGVPEMVGKGASLGIGLAGGKPKILLNPDASKQESIEWNPAILKLAEIVK